MIKTEVERKEKALVGKIVLLVELDLGVWTFGFSSQVGDLHIGNRQIRAIEGNGEVDAVEFGGGKAFEDGAEREIPSRIPDVLQGRWQCG